MLNTSVAQSLYQVIGDPAPDQHLEIQRLLAAAAINKQFCRLLLDEPELALASGFQGETFLLNNEERALVISIRANCLADFARDLGRTFEPRPEVRLSQPVERYAEIYH